MRFINEISQGKLEKLKYLYRKGDNARVRERAHSIILSNKDFTIDQIAKILDVDRDSVSSWFNRWEEHGISGLSDDPKSGRPPILFEDLKKK